MRLPLTSRSWAGLGATAAMCAVVALSAGGAARAQSAPPSTATVASNPTGLVNQIQLLKGQVRDLLGQIEQLQHQVSDLRQISKEQYLALDARISRLEGGTSAQGSGAAPATGSTVAAAAASTGKAPTGKAAGKPAAGKHVAAPAKPGTSAPATAASVATPAGAQSAYTDAFNALREGQFSAATQQFKAFVAAYPQAKLAPNAWYWLGESYYVTQHYAQALTAFDKVLTQFPHSNKAPGALLKKGYSQYALHQTNAAIATLKQVVAAYPGQGEAKLAAQRLDDIQLQQQLQ